MTKMSRPLVCKYLETHSLTELYEEHGVKASIYRHKAPFNYDQIEAKNDDPLACQCRGLILSATCEQFPEEGVVGQTFDRFFNYEEGSTEKIEWKND
jgi:tRNA splicing ligase